MIYILTTRITDSLITFHDTLIKNGNCVTIVVDAVSINTPNNCQPMNIKLVDHKSIKECGFTHVSKASKFKTCAWSYATYLACMSSDDYSWFIEDDVVFSAANTINKIDKCITADLVCKSHYHVKESMDWFYWVEAVNESPFQINSLHRSLQCVTRCSKRLLDEVKKIAESHSRLFFMEYLFNTICAEKNLIVANLSCMQSIHYNVKERQILIKNDDIHHPIKSEPERQYLLRLQHDNDYEIEVVPTVNKYIDTSYNEVMNSLLINLVSSR